MTGSVVKALRECPLPGIAAVNGIAAGAGAVIALASDFRLLAESASFAFLFTRVGLAGADMGSAYLLPRVVGFGRATELLTLGDKVGSQRAYEIGLATEVVPDDQLPDRADTLARRRAGRPGSCRPPRCALAPPRCPAGWPTARRLPTRPPRRC